VKKGVKRDVVVRSDSSESTMARWHSSAVTCSSRQYASSFPRDRMEKDARRALAKSVSEKTTTLRSSSASSAGHSSSSFASLVVNGLLPPCSSSPCLFDSPPSSCSRVTSLARSGARLTVRRKRLICRTDESVGWT